MCQIAFAFFNEHLPKCRWSNTELLIERQMKSGIMRIFAVSIEIAWFHTVGHRAIVLSPILIKRHFGTSKGKYKANKNAAIDLMTTMCVKYGPSFRTEWVKLCRENDKIDDLADAIVQGLYYYERRRGPTCSDH